MEGRVTRFSSGIAGVAIVLFALMGTIGVGYLLNGTSGYENVNDYNYVTDVTGLYSYTPVPAYAEYSPATNNYQYSDSLGTLGTYTSGINYTQAAAANLNPIITPSSGLHTVTGSISYADLSESENNGHLYMGTRSGGDTFQTIKYKTVRLSDVITSLGPTFNSGILSIPEPNLRTYAADANNHGTMMAQSIGVVAEYPSTLSISGSITYANSVQATATNAPAVLTTGGTQNFTYVYANNTYTMNNPVGVLGDIHVNANGTTSYTITLDGQTTTVTKSINEITLVLWKYVWPGWDYTTVPDLTWTSSYYVGIEYLDPNYGVSLSGENAYWSNGNDLGSITWAFQKPSADSSVWIGADSAGDTRPEFSVNYTNNQWQFVYRTSPTATPTVQIGSGWPAVYVRMYYTGEIQVGPIERFFNFTNYELGPSTTYATSYSGNDPIHYCTITETGAMRFAAIGTTVQSGTVPGAMYDATFNAGNYFPQYTDVRISFDSAAYVGTSVQVDTWTMSVDSSSFYGQFIGLDNVTYFADLTQPWAITWNPGSNEVSITFTPRNEVGTITATILNADVARSVTLNGQWVIDTDLYSVGSHVEEVFNWDFGNWGLTKTQFIVCAMGLTALLSIAFRLAHVPIRGLDFVVIFFGNLIMWVVL